MADQSLPPDVYEDSRFRLPLPAREDLDEYAQRSYDSLTDPNGTSVVGPQGPGGIGLYSSGAARHQSAFNQYLRFESGFSGQVRELTILVAAREMDSQFEWAAHEPQALKEGLSAEIIDIVRHRGDTSALPEEQAVIIEFGRQLIRTRRVEPDLFARALALFDRHMMVNFVYLMSSYTATALLLAAFDVHLPPGKEPGLPVG